MNEMNKGIRIINFVVDIVVISSVSGIIGMIFNNINYKIIFYSVFLAYYFICEVYSGQTIGKKITKTVVVDINNSKPSIRRILLRTILRLNPFDGISYLFGKEQGTHDIISKTRLKHKKST